MAESLFGVTFLAALPFWALLILAPTWSWTRRVAASPLIVLPPLVIYAVLVLPDLATVLPAVTHPQFDGIRTLLGSGTGAAIAWAHFIAFDLFVGRFLYLDSRRRDIHPLVMAPLMVLTILLAPLGLLAYLAVRRPVSRRTPAPGTEPV
ncbi:DUF4281 domain-containing protein [Solihabitans fulvus]|uniref:DUF4281 domain-containing protein n=1 Tax=Solihabitans fulvus TaxID=1892852 RepID=A0A5B2WTU2_9PSEU|nr:ABA4-like family protein [Solihabitans fulvus]KAA2253849.1 DUF4281 domain-containing protein [Solihabitans fulvus]